MRGKLWTQPETHLLCGSDVDDTMTHLHEYFIDEFSYHLNSIDEYIKFTSECIQDGKLPFLDTCIHITDDGTTTSTVCRKPTHTDQYLNDESNHPLEHKRFESLVTEQAEIKAEIDQVKVAFRTNVCNSYEKG